MDDSLSASTLMGVYGALADRAELTVIARYRIPGTAVAPRGTRLLPVTAPRLPGFSMLWFHAAAGAAIARESRACRADAILLEPSILPSLLIAHALAPGRIPPACLDVRTLPITSRGARTLIDRMYFAAVLRLARRLCVGFTAITPGVADWLAARARVDRARVTVWAGGVDTTLFDPSRYDAPDPADRPVRLLYHGAVYASRGLGSLIEAMSLLAADETGPVRLTILGSGPDSRLLASLVERLDLADSVRMIDPVPHSSVPAEIAGHHAGIVPLPDLDCWRTSSPTKLFEYTAMAKPVVVTDIEAHRAIAADELGFAWAGGGSAPEIAAAIRDLIARLPELTAAARDARDRLAEANSWDARSLVLLQVLERLPRKAPRGGS